MDAGQTADGACVSPFVPSIETLSTAAGSPFWVASLYVNQKPIKNVV